MERIKANMIFKVFLHLAVIFMWLVVIPHYWFSYVSGGWLTLWKCLSVFFAIVTFLKLRKLVRDSGDTKEKQD